MGGKRIEECKSPEARALPTLDMALRRIVRDQVDDMGVAMEMRLVSGHGGDVRARIYTPQNALATGPRPVILFLHGGGFVLGDVDNYDASPRALAARTGPTVLVSNEVGLGIVPENALARRFRDAQGVLNQTLAAQAQRVIMMVAGLPVAVKSP